MRTLNRRQFLSLTAAAGLTGSLSSCRSPGDGRGDLAAKRPNIIFVLADDLGYGDLGCYGQKTIDTPNLDLVAAQGMRFTQHYAGSTVCAPSRCALMTGLHTGHCYVRGNKEFQPMGQLPLPEDTVTLPKLLQKAGYATALIGKWGLGGPGSTGTPNEQGFDYFFGYLCQRHAHNYYPEFLFRNDQRVPLEGNKIPNPRSDGAGVAIERTQYSHDLIAAEALQFIVKNKDRPFFLYLAATLPHANNEAGRRGMEVPDYGQYARQDWPDAQKGHAAMITRLDRDFGRIIETLQRLGIDENTLVLFTSDNGPHQEGGAHHEFFNSNGELRGRKRDLYEGGIRVPLIARWPGKIQPGTVTDHVCAFWDFLPTFVELADKKPPRRTDGISIVPTLLGRPEQQKQHDFLYWEFHEGGFKQAVRWRQYKALRAAPGKPLEIYNLANDPGEQNNVADTHPDVVREVERYLKTARTDSPHWPVKSVHKES